ncbi:DNA-directed RNA polymerase II [Actinoplanes sp. LDG1-06]|uniref:DNA-directed RNA polymerase II n=1 Tax=Paractinoplanes ovalisporus TaxID=2810368 RepID=A0ABS2AUP6_9ACTN|nr:DNA-directed RNA polymerase II [Actinoplanes ovalisporus]MBM2623531.1 DNA-directed RNA polymerase II [Actinoplanes ovalisporus]
MPEQPQWSERTLDMPPQDPWADAPTTPNQGASHPTTPHPTTPFPASPAAPQAEERAPFSQGRAQVNARPHQPYAEHEPTGTGWPGAPSPAAHRGMSWKWSELRLGSEWTSAAVLFAFVCWGIWALSGEGPFGTPTVVLVVTLAVAVGVFCLARLVGYLVLERQMGRVRRTARGSHLVTALFLAGVGVAWLQQTEWVMTAVNWVTGLFGG